VVVTAEDQRILFFVDSDTETYLVIDWSDVPREVVGLKCPAGHPVRLYVSRQTVERLSGEFTLECALCRSECIAADEDAVRSISAAAHTS
jgi:hypothetical protein